MLLDSLPHVCTARRRSRSSDGMIGSVDAYPEILFEDRECWRQPVSDREVYYWDQRSILVSNKIYFASDPNLLTQDIVSVDGKWYEVMSFAVPDKSVGLQKLWKVMVQQVVIGGSITVTVTVTPAADEESASSASSLSSKSSQSSSSSWSSKSSLSSGSSSSSSVSSSSSSAIDTYKADYDANWATYSAGFTDYATHGGWSGSTCTGHGYDRYVIDAALAMYEATGDSTYFLQALTIAELAIADADVVSTGGYLCWPGYDTNPYYGNPSWTRTEGSGSGVSYQLWDYSASTGFARIAAIGLNDANLTAYTARITAVYTFVKTHIVEKWLEGWSDWWPNLPGQYQIAGNAISDRWIDLLLTMALIAKANPVAAFSLPQSGVTLLYSNRVTYLATLVDARFASFGDGQIWDHGLTYPETTETDWDTSHGNIMVVLLEALYDLGGTAFAFGDCEDVAFLLDDYVWNQDIDDPAFSNYISGSNNAYLTYTDPWENGTIYSGWARLGRFETQAQQIMAAAWAGMKAGKPNSLISNNYSSYGRVLMPAHLARNIAKCLY